MIKKIKFKIKRFIDYRVRLLRDQQHQNQQINFDYNQLSHLFKEDSFIPFSAWAISPSTILHVLNDISINKRNRIIEFGSGASTFYIAKLIKTLKLKASFYSVESDKEWANELESLLKLYEISDFVRVIYAPLSTVPNEYKLKEQSVWYDVNKLDEALKDDAKFDLVLVDGPFGGSTPYARYSAIPYLKSLLSKNASIYLDDTNRKDEKEIIVQWLKILGFDRFDFERYSCLKPSQNFDVSPFQLSKPGI
ncbi:class I SAM-dependent methyltransferase [Gillisia sp. M10.2A]|uniref:Class I SAM-dependent methyltransferase n=1 Tax=Gillisia lutea TaxID=2909668 RepID=A0ABS9EIV6_9FLAO|nr:class I SAM-dependent methyltransferase [Gillisia lutea]MCF4102114.1 class I SAM-dependent methyltransferase [Gillisia lutea]